MPIRVSQRNLFANFVNNMNFSLSNLMDSNIQASSQKRINKPSDDPVGMARVLNYRDSLRSIDQYRENVDTAQGWLGLADETLMQVNTVLTRVKELAEQTATGTMSASNRDQVGFEVRELFGQLINLSNSQFEGKHVFAGHKTADVAFVESLGLTTQDATVAASDYSLSGSADSTVIMQVLENPPAYTDTAQVGLQAVRYRYSADGGDTWTESTTITNEFDMGGVRLTMENGTTVTAVDPDNVHETDNGTWIYVRPAALYQGDDEDQVEVDLLGANNLAASTEGNFSEDVLVRIDNATPVSLASNISYSYSLDGGSTWVEGNTISDASTPNSASLIVPGGFLNLASNGGNTLKYGDQFVIRPRRADMNLEISPSEYLTVNSVGKDIFGGVYVKPGESNATAALDGEAGNMFEAVGQLVGYIETNNQEGIQAMLASLDASSEHIMVNAASIGARENRLDVADNILSSLELSEQDRMSNIEDIDVAELMTKLAQQELIYQSVLKSSSMIMRMNLTNFI